MNFSPEEIYSIWEKADIVFGISPDIYRKDECGAWIAFDEFGNNGSSLGWKVDYISPNLNEGKDEVSNFRPLHWQNKRSQENGELVCVVSTNWNKITAKAFD